MGLLAKKNGDNDIEPIEEGVHVGLCYGVIDLGTHLNMYGKNQRKVLIQFEIPSLRIEYEKDGKQVNLPRATSKRYTLSLDDRANLRKDLESWRGKKFTDDELEGFDLQKLLGVPCQLQIVHNKGKDGRTFANIQTVMALPKGMPRPAKTENPHMFFAFDEGDAEPSIPKELPDWIVEILFKSNEITGANKHPTSGKEMPVKADDGETTGNFDGTSEPLPF